MSVMVTKTELRHVLVELGDMELQLLKLKSKLLPRTKATKKELAAMEAAERDIERGLGIQGGDFVKELLGR